MFGSEAEIEFILAGKGPLIFCTYHITESWGLGWVSTSLFYTLTRGNVCRHSHKRCLGFLHKCVTEPNCGQTHQDENNWEILIDNGHCWWLFCLNIHMQLLYTVQPWFPFSHYKALSHCCSTVPQMGEVRDKPIVSYVGDSVVILCKMEEAKPKPSHWSWYKENNTAKVGGEKNSKGPLVWH